MDSAIMLAKIFGPFLAIVGLWMLIYRDNLMKVVTSMKSSPAALYMSALISLILGLFIIIHYNGWRMDIYTFVTLLGWVLFLRGLLGLFMPHVIVIFTSKPSWVKVMGVIPLVWGLILIWAGFYR